MLIIAKGMGISLLVTNKSISQCLLDGTQQLKQNIGEYHARFYNKKIMSWTNSQSENNA